jgi:alkylation response protein AidB-like acyl-CoA dehydrogenase
VDFHDSPNDAAFRREARAWLDAHAQRRRGGAAGLSALMSERGDDPQFLQRSRAWQRVVAEGGWGAIIWPTAYGGRDASMSQLFVWGQETARYDVPPNVCSIGLRLIGPTLIAHGTPEQKTRYLPAMLRGEDVWCQLWSEPNAGSDLASLQTRAERTPSGVWILNGQKVWTSGAHCSDLGLIIVRTDPGVPKHNGISCFVVDMRCRGISVRPLRQMTGGANFNEVFFDDVVVPQENPVGDVNDGWRFALTTLMNELYGAAALDVTDLVRPVAELARKTGALDDTLLRQGLADAYARAKLITLTSYGA